MARVLHVFVDEYGDTSLQTEKSGVSDSYIISAVVVKDASLADVRGAVEKLRHSFFQSGEMKSSAIGAKDRRRIALLSKLNTLDFFTISFCAQKAKVDPDSGLGFKKSFVKFFAKKLYERLSRLGANLVVVADEHGDQEFREEFKKYLERHFASDLFKFNSFEFANSKAEVLLQAADVYAGSLARHYDTSKASDGSRQIASLALKNSSLTQWPNGYETGAGRAEHQLDSRDLSIHSYCLGRAQSYIERYENSQDPEEAARVEFLGLLLSHQAWEGEADFISTRTLLREVNRRLPEPLKVHKFRTSIVAKLRDDEVIIASSQKGYKIPSSYADLREFVSHANSMIPPMISRIEKARKGIHEATLGDVDVLAEADFAELKQIVDSHVSPGL